MSGAPVTCWKGFRLKGRQECEAGASNNNPTFSSAHMCTARLFSPKMPLKVASQPSFGFMLPWDFQITRAGLSGVVYGNRCFFMAANQSATQEV